MGLIERIRERSRRSKRKATDSSDLFDDAFQRKLEYLSIVSKRVFSGRMRAERRTKKVGSGIEFADYRDYQPGDDIRYLDWNVYQKFDRLLLRLFEEEEDLAVYVVLDASGSMAFRNEEKLKHAKKIAAALSYVALSNLDRVSVTALGDRIFDSLGETRSKAKIFKVFEFLRNIEPGGNTDLRTALKAFVARNKRRGLVVLLSDLYDPQGFEQAINVLRFNRFEPFVVHIASPEDATLPAIGDLALYDTETGEEREVTVTRTVLTQFREAYREYLVEIERFCATHSVPYVRADTDVAFDELILRVFRRGGFLR